MTSTSSDSNYWSSAARVIPIFTPGLLGPEILRKIFVGRQALLDGLISDLRSGVNQVIPVRNNLLIAGRGGGKTTLVTLTYHGLREDSTLYPRLCIALLREDEDDITSWSAMLVRIFRALALEYSEQRDDLNDLADRLRRLPLEESELEGEVALRNFIGERCFILFVENFEYILDSIVDDEGEEGIERLHAFLVESRSVTLATAPAFDTKCYPPFEGFFDTKNLEELTLDQARDLLIKIAENIDYNEGLAEYLRKPEALNRLRVIRELAGGNPRIWVIFSDTIALSHLEKLVPLFLLMLDQLVPLYQERMRALPAQERRIVTFLRDAGGAIPVKEIAEACRMTPNACAALLGKLTDKSYVQKARELKIPSSGDGRVTYYELREPLMRFCLQAKETRAEPLQLIVEFLRLWFREDEIQDKLKSLPANNSLITRAYLLATISRRAQVRTDIGRINTKAGKFYRYNKYEDALNEYLKALQSDPNDAASLARCAIAFAALGLKEDADNYINQAFNVDSQNAAVWNNKGVVFYTYGNYEDALRCFDHAHDIEPSNGSVWNNRGCALSGVDRFTDAVECFVRAVGIDSDDVTALSNLGVTYNKLGFYEKAIEALDNAINIDPDYPRALLNRCVTLLHLDRVTDAQLDFDRALSVDPNAPLPEDTGIITFDQARQEKEKIKIYESIINEGLEDSISLWDRLTWAMISLDHKDTVDCLNIENAVNAGSVFLQDAAIQALRGNNEGAILALIKSASEGRSHERGLIAASTVVLRNLLESNGQQDLWQEWFTSLTDVFGQAKILPLLAKALTRNLSILLDDRITDSTADDWLMAWEKAAKLHLEMDIVRRLLRATVLWKSTNDRGALLRLPQEERSVLEEILNKKIKQGNA